MTMHRRHFLAAASSLAVASPTSWAQAYPNKPIKLVVPFPPGGGADNLARAVAPKLAEYLGQAIVIDNKPGAGGNLGSEGVARAAADGYTLLYGTNGTHGTNHALYARTGFELRDFATLGRVSFIPAMLVVNPTLPVQTAAQLLTYLQANPGKLSFASAGNGTAPHFAAELYKLNMKASWMHVPYKGSAPAVNDTVAGHTHIMFPSLFTALPHVKSGKLHAVGIAGSRRSPALPGVPTLKELGIPGVDVTQWYALFVPAKTPKAVVDKLNAALNQVLTDKDTVARIEAQGADVQTSTPEELKTLVRDDLAKWRRVVQQAKLSAD
jgi:tripartite-type tricarboxylate transporter receptor subunit TctC